MKRGSIIDSIMFMVESMVIFLATFLAYFFVLLIHIPLYRECLITRDYTIKEIINHSTKMWVLKLVHGFAIAHDALNRKIIFKYSLFFTFSLFFAQAYMTANPEINGSMDTHEAIRNGFFIAPLITLMFAQLAKIIEIFLSVFNTKPICKECVAEMKNNISGKAHNSEISLDLYSVQVQKGLYTAARNLPNFTEKEKEIWKIFDSTRTYANANRDNYERENTQALLIAATLLFAGYMYFIQDMILVATTLLIFSFTILLNRLALGIRTVLKFYLIGELAIVLAGSSEKKTRNELKSAISNAID